MSFIDEVINSEVPVIVDFYANFCPPCKAMEPVLKDIQAEGYKVVKVNVGEKPELATQYKIGSVPTIVVFNDGVEVFRSVGVTKKATILSVLERE